MITGENLYSEINKRILDKCHYLDEVVNCEYQEDEDFVDNVEHYIYSKYTKLTVAIRRSLHNAVGVNRLWKNLDHWDYVSSCAMLNRFKKIITQMQIKDDKSIDKFIENKLDKLINKQLKVLIAVDNRSKPC